MRFLQIAPIGTNEDSRETFLVSIGDILIGHAFFVGSSDADRITDGLHVDLGFS